MRIEARIACPRCGQARVVQRSRATYVCFQCRNAWSTDVLQTIPAPDPLRGWPPEQRRRLEAVRAAVQAGFYTDWF